VSIDDEISVRLKEFYRKDEELQDLYELRQNDEITQDEFWNELCDKFYKSIAQIDYRKDPLTDEEAFELFNNYHRVKKHSLPIEVIHELATRKFQRYYNVQGFRKIHSRKSKHFLLNQHLFIRKDDLFIKAGCSNVDRFGFIQVEFIALQAISSPKGMLYVIRHGEEAREKEHNDQPDMLMTGHLFDRYAERNDLKMKRDEALKHFLTKEYDRLTCITVSEDPKNNCTSLALKNGMCFGFRVKDVIIFKTFVESAKLGNNQLLDSMILKNFEEDTLKATEEALCEPEIKYQLRAP